MSKILALVKSDNNNKDINNKPCLEIKNNRLYCRKKSWYIKDCPFETLHECNSFTDMCGGIL